MQAQLLILAHQTSERLAEILGDEGHQDADGDRVAAHQTEHEKGFEQTEQLRDLHRHGATRFRLRNQVPAGALLC